MSQPDPAGRRTFWPVVLIGIGASGVAALAGHRPMMQVQVGKVSQLGAGAIAEGDNFKDLPLAGACGLVMLACWGVVLVTRKVTRRIVATLAGVTAVSLLLTLVVEGFVKHDDVVIELRAPIDYTGWFWLALAAAVPALLAAAAAVRFAPAWPEMGRQYDAPSAQERTSSGAPPEERTSLDLWKSMDEGNDPTDQ
jgi:uncharacterized membrane protein (TIGR02234 family)